MTTTEKLAHGMCAECEQPVYSGEGVTVSPDGEFWHRDCRAVFNRKNASAIEKRPVGRPRKEAQA